MSIKQWILDFPNAVGIVDAEGRARLCYTNKGHTSRAFDLTSSPRHQRLIDKIKKDGDVLEGDEPKKKRKYARNKN